MGKEVLVHFACNGDGGHFAGKVAAASVFGNELETDGMVEVRFRVVGDHILMHRHRFRFRSRVYWIGNWCWDAFWMPTQEYRRLIRILARNGWRCTAGEVRWGNAFEALNGAAS